MAKKNQQPQSGQSPQDNLQQGNSNQQPQSGTFFGNKDADERFALPEDWKKSVCVWQCKVDVMNGGMVEVPNTHQLQTYEPKQFDKLSNGDKDSPSFFSESKMKVTVLHDPRLAE